MINCDVGAPTEDKPNDYLDFKPQSTAASSLTVTAESDYMAMPGASKSASRPGLSDTSSSGQSSDYELTARVSATTRTSIIATSHPSASIEYMQMAIPASNSAKAGPDVAAKRVSHSNAVAAGGKKALSSTAKGSSDYVSMKTPTDEGYMDMKTGSQRSSSQSGAYYFGKRKFTRLKVRRQALMSQDYCEVTSI